MKSGEDNVNSELYKYTPAEFKLRFPQFLNNIHTKNVFHKQGAMPLQSHYLRQVTQETRKITEELVFLTSAVGYTHSKTFKIKL
jgi:hypothetical protein